MLPEIFLLKIEFHCLSMILYFIKNTIFVFMETGLCDRTRQHSSI
jgi:hypothetical protein